MKPAWSLTSTGVLPHASANWRAVAKVSSDAVSGRTSSTRDITGAGLKKWTPHTLSGRPVCMANSMTGRVDVLVARMAWSSVIRSSSLKSSFLTARSSTTDSITRSTPLRALKSEVPVTRDNALPRSSSVFLPFSTCRLSDFSRAAMVASAVDWLRDRSTTSKPLTAAVSAMPEPMIPDPTIPTRAIDIGNNRSGGPVATPAAGWDRPERRSAAGGPAGGDGPDPLRALVDEQARGEPVGGPHGLGPAWCHDDRPVERDVVEHVPSQGRCRIRRADEPGQHVPDVGHRRCRGQVAGVPLVQQGGLDHPGADHAHPHTVVGCIDPEPDAEADYGVFGRGVGHQQGAGNEARQRRGVHDVAPPLLDHEGVGGGDVTVDVGDQHGGAAVDQLCGEGPPDAGCRPGHDGSRPVEVRPLHGGPVTRSAHGSPSSRRLRLPSPDPTDTMVAMSNPPERPELPPLRESASLSAPDVPATSGASDPPAPPPARAPRTRKRATPKPAATPSSGRPGRVAKIAAPRDGATSAVPADRPWPGPPRGRGRSRMLYNRRLQRTNERWPLATRLGSALFSRPGLVLGLTGGRSPVERDGRVLNRSVQALLAVVNRMEGFSDGPADATQADDPAAMRTRLTRMARLAMPVRTDVHVTGRVIPGPEGAPDLLVRVYRQYGTGIGPTSGGRGRPPAIVYYHGGGWVTGDLDSHDASCRLLAAVSGCIVVAVDYRLAPEDP